ncbi:esterase [Bifidobacterium stellenboschense]|uniref:Esterase n=2 Tax=Bifidobacterium stellenboschense TaxID=762211 RepID=A0A087DJI2_9BIFI|nr:alpha/beta hydrolase-fold protein [Bifidobacterium stellenboschense]KFI95682.1 esterase [Bifidobacterium stellenboschense]
MQVSLVRGVLPRTVFAVTACAAIALVISLVIALVRPAPGKPVDSVSGADCAGSVGSAESSSPTRRAATPTETVPTTVIPTLSEMVPTTVAPTPTSTPAAPPALLLPILAIPATTAIAGLAGLLLAWFLSDGIMVFGVSLGWPVIITAACGFAGLGAIAATIVVANRRRAPRAAARRITRAIAVILIPLTLVATGLRIDAIFGEYQTIGSLVGYTPYPSLDSVTVHRAAMTVAQWRAAAARHAAPDHPAHGRILSVTIPNTKSHFNARKAMVYLPPAALAKRPPRLPVMELLAGQPGSPGRLVAAAGLARMMDAYADAHDGLAPVVVVPDQNGADTHNSLCADTSQGNAETYLTRDVVAWTKRTLPVAATPRMWAIGGFSQGGTCTTQLAPRHPDLYSAMLPVDGELKPTNGSVADMTTNYFRGRRADYDAQVPVNALAALDPDEARGLALFAGAGERDKDSIRNMRTIAAAARKAGVSDITEIVVPGRGHDWHAVQAVWRPGVDWFGARTGLGEMTKSIKEYPQVEVQQ